MPRNSSLAIEPQADRYGTDARRSALADLLEVRALQGHGYTQVRLADWVRDSDWTRIINELPWREPCATDEEGEEDADAKENPERQEEAAELVFCVLRERARVLGQKYPFDLGPKLDKIQVKTNHPRSTYLAMLATCFAHQYLPASSIGAVKPTSAFESVVTEFLKTRGLRAVITGTGRGGNSGTIESRMREAAVGIGLPEPNFLEYVRRRAKDGGLDALARIDWQDDRIGQCIFLTQVTCGKSDTWRKKTAEARDSQYWTEIFGERHLIPMLAVPYHVEQFHWRELTKQQSVLLIDRLRLSLCDVAMSSSINELVDAMLSSQIGWD